MNNSIFLQDKIKKIDLLAYCKALDVEVKKTLEDHSHIWDEYLAFSPDKMIVLQQDKRSEIKDKAKIKQAQTTIVSDFENTLSVQYYFYLDEKLIFEKWINGCDFLSQRDIGEFYLKHEGGYSFIFSNNGKIKNYIYESAKDNEMIITDSYMSFLPIFTRMISIRTIDYSITITNFQYEIQQTIKTKENFIEKNLLLAIKDQFKEKITDITLEKDVKSYYEKIFDDFRGRGFQTIEEIEQEENK